MTVAQVLAFVFIWLAVPLLFSLVASLLTRAMEAVSLEMCIRDRVQVNVIHKGVGQISESDVSLAAASDAIIVGFQVRPSGAAAKRAEQEGVDIRCV